MNSRARWLIAGLVALALVVAIAGWPELGGSPAGAGAALAVTIGWGSIALAWLLAAAGLGWPLRVWLVPGLVPAACRGSIQLTLGIAAMLTVDAALARSGAVGPGISAATIIVGVGLGLEQARRHWRSWSWPSLPWLAIAGVVPVAALMVAACSAPGWLWTSEFGGYDALSYHLQLPKEWNSLGTAAGLEHNVYSFLPSYMELAYAHVFAVGGNTLDAAYACQLLHGGIAIAVAFVTGRLALSLAARANDGAPARAGVVAAIVVLGTPWVVVVGSLAYNEMVLALMLAGALQLVLGHEGTNESGSAGAPGAKALRLGLALGVLLGAACGAKPTAALFVVAPVLVLLACRMDMPARARAGAFVATGIAGAITLAPALLWNTLTTGNPVFPLLADTLGSGHWTAEQVTIWNDGHGAALPFIDRLRAAWDQYFRYGFGAAPAPGEPWAAQWSILPWLVLLAIPMAWRARASDRPIVARLVVVLVVQLALWLTLTHVKSRFLLPTVVPSAIIVALGFRGLETWLARWCPSAVRAILATLVIAAYAGGPLVRYAQEGSGYPALRVGAIQVLAGDAHATRLAESGLTDPERAELLAGAPPALWLNHRLDETAVVLCLGDATPFYYRMNEGHPTVWYQTTWDRGLWSTAARAANDDAALVAHLRDHGVTHVLVNPIMLRLWEQERWHDPALTNQRVLSVCTDHAREIFRFGDETRLFELRRDR